MPIRFELDMTGSVPLRRKTYVVRYCQLPQVVKAALYVRAMDFGVDRRQVG